MQRCSCCSRRQRTRMISWHSARELGAGLRRGHARYLPLCQLSCLQAASEVYEALRQQIARVGASGSGRFTTAAPAAAAAAATRALPTLRRGLLQTSLLHSQWLEPQRVLEERGGRQAVPADALVRGWPWRHDAMLPPLGCRRRAAVMPVSCRSALFPIPAAPRSLPTTAGQRLASRD